MQDAPKASPSAAWIGLSDPRIVPITPAIGAEIKEMDLARGVSDADMALARDALNRFSVIVLRDQHLSPPQQIEFSRRLGPIRVTYMSHLAPQGFTELLTISNIKKNGEPIGLVDAGALWHSDGSYVKIPDLYTVLYALEVPQRDGQVLGDTCFVSTAAAYDDLPTDIKRRIAGRKAVHSIEHHVKKKIAANFKAPPLSAAQREALPDVEHPIIRTHPVTGRKCIYATEGHTRSIAGMPEAESEELLKFLWAHVTKPEYLYRHNWRVGDLVVWDNCATQHLAITDYGDIPRRLHRAGIAGPVPT